MTPPLDPTKTFGDVSCERELQLFSDNFQEYYFDHVPFNDLTLEKNAYLIIGRRGSGKTSLSRYFTFHNNHLLKNSVCIDVDKPDLYNQVLKEMAAKASDTNFAISRIVLVWEYVIWALIFKRYKEYGPAIESAAFFTEKDTTPGNFIFLILKSLINKFFKDDNRISEGLDDLLTNDVIKKAKEELMSITAKKPVIIAIDTLEHYDVNDESMMRATAALIECASNFNAAYTRHGVHVKAFISAEVYPHLVENYVSNTLKYISNPIHLNWRPRDLIRLLCWRLSLFLEENSFINKSNLKNIDWSNFKDVYNNIWIEYFGETLTNKNGLIEKTFPYILRHSQMRPRQLVILCNNIGALSAQMGAFPTFTPEVIVKAVSNTEISLADEVISSYKSIYPNVGKIIDPLAYKPIIFKGKLLDKLAPESASSWTAGNYSPLNFRQLISELGIIGRVREIDVKTKIVQADFEYNIFDRLKIQPNEDYVFHPMFIKKLSISNPEKFKVYPFPKSDSYNELYLEY